MHGTPLTVVAQARTSTHTGERPVTVGSGPDADVRVEDPRVSPLHALISYTQPAGHAWSPP